MGDAAAVADDVQSRVPGLQMLIHRHFHIVEFDLHAIEQSVIIGGAGGDLIQGVEHLDDAVQEPLGQHQT